MKFNINNLHLFSYDFNLLCLYDSELNDLYTQVLYILPDTNIKYEINEI